MTIFKNYIFLLILSGILIITSSFYSIDNVCLSRQEVELYNLINSYRNTKGLNKVNLSKSLTYVAQIHAWDLAENNPDKQRCNMHSWSESKKWEGCCYTSDHKKAECMWFKPRELTNYTGIGYEVAFYSTYLSDHKKFSLAALQAWKKSKGHNDILINDDDWKGLRWEAMGVGIYKNYAVVWFGDEVDEETKADQCF